MRRLKTTHLFHFRQIRCSDLHITRRARHAEHFVEVAVTVKGKCLSCAQNPPAGFDLETTIYTSGACQ